MANVDEKVTSFENKFVDVANFVHLFCTWTPRLNRSFDPIAVSANFLFLFARLCSIDDPDTPRDVKYRETKILDRPRLG